MHLLIPCAGVLSEAGLQALRSLQLPQLARLLGELTATARDEASETSRNPPHERALARALGWPDAGDGCLPWGAWLAQRDGGVTGPASWGLLSPTHQHAGTQQVSLLDPDALALDEATSRTLFDAVRPQFESEGFATAWGAPQRWYVAHPLLDGLATASLDRVIGRNVDAWLPDQPQARLLRRLQMEVQMLLYTHPLNDAREAAGQFSVNATWLSGCGRLPAGTPPADVSVDDRLRRPALNEDWPAWAAAWQALDDGPLSALRAAAQQGESVQLTLCGERAAQRFETRPRSLLNRIAAHWRPATPVAMLEAL
ncbi:MAG: hypothetical protein ABI574_15555 [Burkholderiales bacterium]